MCQSINNIEYNRLLFLNDGKVKKQTYKMFEKNFYDKKELKNEKGIVVECYRDTNKKIK